jgi:catechol 2,3-dioxygenase-like lactoylglutathione lyase family enzyme
MIVGLDHVQVAAPPDSETEARRFYGGLLGLPEIPKPAGLQSSGGVWFTCGTQELHIGIEPSFSPATKAHPAFAVEASELDGVAQRLTDAGTAVQWDLRVPERRRFYATDPWGNRLELTEPTGGTSAT